MKFRRHRGSLQESMETVVEIEPTFDGSVIGFTDSPIHHNNSGETE